MKILSYLHEKFMIQIHIGINPSNKNSCPFRTYLHGRHHQGGYPAFSRLHEVG